MSKAVYRIAESSDGLYELFEGDILLTTFRRESFQRDLSQLGRGSSWVGSILRLFNKWFPSTMFTYLPQTPLDRVILRLGHKGIAEYLQAKGYIVYKHLDVPDDELIHYLEASGYVIQKKTYVDKGQSEKVDCSAFKEVGN